MVKDSLVSIFGNDDFLVNERAKKFYQDYSEGIDDAFSLEILEGHTSKVQEAETVIQRLLGAVQTLPMFGRKVVWLKNINFLADTVTGRSQTTQDALENLQENLAQINSKDLTVILSASPVDRRKKFAKWIQKNSQHTFIDVAKEGAVILPSLIQESCKKAQVKLTREAQEMLIAKVNGNTRLIKEEIQKLAHYLGEPQATIDESLVLKMVPNFGEGDFFEVVEAFYALDLPWTLSALRQHFFHNPSARPIISSLLGRNRLLIQLRSLIDQGLLHFGPRGFSKSEMENAKNHFATAFSGLEEKTNFNVFSQNPWYLGKLCKSIHSLTLKTLLDWQIGFVGAFESIIESPKEEESAMRSLVIQSLSSLTTHSSQSKNL